MLPYFLNKNRYFLMRIYPPKKQMTNVKSKNINILNLIKLNLTLMDSFKIIPYGNTHYFYPD